MIVPGNELRQALGVAIVSNSAANGSRLSGFGCGCRFDIRLESGGVLIEEQITRDCLTTIPHGIVSGQIIIKRFCEVDCRAGTAAKKSRFFYCLESRFLCRIARNKAWMARRLDISPGSAVQNILKKVKKRLVSPIKPR
jgi:hypothetical protein